MNESIVLILQLFLSTVHAFSTGLPPGICMTPYPQHIYNKAAILAQPSHTVPYTISLSSNTYTNGMMIKIVISSNISTSFQGIMMTFKPNTSEIVLPVGQFLNCDAAGFKFYSVQGNNNSCLVHSNGDTKPQNVTCTYIAPYTNYGPLRMSAVIVKNYASFWTRLEQVLPYLGPTSLQNITNPTQILQNTIDKSGCMKTKSCIFFPNLCLLSSTCVFMVSYKQSGAYVDFEIMGPDLGYIAIGISNDTTMNDDLVITCVKDPDSNVLLIQTGYTTILNYESKMMLNSVDDNIINRKASQSTVANTTRFCTFSVLANLTYPYNVKFPTNLSQSLNIFLANGALLPNTPFVTYHNEPPLILFTRTILYKSSLSPNTYFNGLNYIKQVHGSLMSVAFIILLPMAVMIARHFRYQFQVDVRGKQLWFYLHVIFNIFFYIFAFSGYFYIISQINGNWVLEPQIHGSVGTVVMILAAINIIIGFSRPDIDAPRRRCFYLVHLINGTLIRILSFTAFWLVFFTLTLRTAFKNWMMMVVVIWTGGEIIFSIVYGILRQGKAKNKYQVSDTTVPPAATNHVGSIGVVLYVIFIITMAVALLAGLWLN